MQTDTVCDPGTDGYPVLRTRTDRKKREHRSVRGEVLSSLNNNETTYLRSLIDIQQLLLQLAPERAIMHQTPRLPFLQPSRCVQFARVQAILSPGAPRVTILVFA